MWREKKSQQETKGGEISNNDYRVGRECVCKRRGSPFGKLDW